MRAIRSNLSNGAYVRSQRLYENFNNFHAVLLFTETFAGWVAVLWNPITPTSVFAETFVGWVTSLWALTPSSAFTEDFSAGWP